MEKWVKEMDKKIKKEAMGRVIANTKNKSWWEGYDAGKQEMIEASKSLIVVAEALDDFKYKAYSMMPKIKTNRQYKDFIMSNAPCSYDLRMIISELKKKAGVA